MKRLAMATALALATLVAVYALWRLGGAIALFVLSLALAAAVRPAIERVLRSGLPRTIGLTATFVLGAAAAAALAVLVGGLLLAELGRVGEDLVAVHEHVETFWAQGNSLQQAIARRLPDPADLIPALAGEAGDEALQAVLGQAFDLGEAVMNVVVIVVLAIYWSLDRVHFERLWLSLLPVKQRAAGRDLWREIEWEVGAYLRSEVVQSLLAGALLGATYWALGFRYPTIMALVAALVLLLPWVGAVAAGLALMVVTFPALVLETYVDVAGKIGGGLVVTTAVLVWLEFCVEPRFFNRRRYNSLLMVVAVVAMADAFGVLGLLLGPPLAVTIQALGERFVRLRVYPAIAEESQPLARLEERLAAVRAGLADLVPARADLASLADRLEELISQSRAALGQTSTEGAPSTP